MATVSGSTGYTVVGGTTFTGSTPYAVQAALTSTTITRTTTYSVSDRAILYRYASGVLMPLQVGRVGPSSIVWLTP